MKKYIPNTITSINLLCGVLGVIFALSGRFDLAFYLMLGACVADFLDGLAARALGAYSDMGKELDSLSDLVSFGVLPSVMMVRMMQLSTFSNSFFCYIPVVLAVFSGLRLAKFNVDERQHESFIGLPTPASALLVGSLCYFMAHNVDTFLAAWGAGYVFLPVLSVVLSLLLVCELPMFSLKFKRNEQRVVVLKRLSMLVNILLIIVIVACLGLNWSLVVLLSMVVYVLMNIAFAIAGI